MMLSGVAPQPIRASGVRLPSSHFDTVALAGAALAMVLMAFTRLPVMRPSAAMGTCV